MGLISNPYASGTGTLPPNRAGQRLHRSGDVVEPGETVLIAPLLGELMRRILPGDAWRT